jgi:hypothetical protein
MSGIVRVLDGLQTIPEFATDAHKHERTINRWIGIGMPVIRIGRQIMIDPSAARRWFEQGMPPAARAKPSPMRRRA